jgi:hypothetical protein
MGLSSEPCARCGFLYLEADVEADYTLTEGARPLCPTCLALEQRLMRIAAARANGRLPSRADREAQAQHNARENKARADMLASALSAALRDLDGNAAVTEADLDQEGLP